MQRHIEVYLAEPTSYFCLLLDGADDLFDSIDETDREFWKKGLHVFDAAWNPVPIDATYWPKGVALKFDFMYGLNELKQFANYEKRQGLINITIVQ